MRVRYSARANRQIEDIFARIKLRNVDAAQDFLDRIEHVTSLLALFPYMGLWTDEANVHSFPLRPFPYRMFYAARPGRNEIMILRLHHASREG